jgi:hypothetical protein
MNELRMYNADADGEIAAASSNGGGFDWNNVVGSIGDWLNGASNIIDSVKGNPDNYNVTYEEKSNTGLYIGLGLASVVFLVFVLAFRKSA